MMTSTGLCRDELALAVHLGRQLRQQHASAVEVAGTVEEAFDHEEARSVAMREAFRQRVVRLRAVQREEA